MRTGTRWTSLIIVSLPGMVVSEITEGWSIVSFFILNKYFSVPFPFLYFRELVFSLRTQLPNKPLGGKILTFLRARGQ